MSSITNEQLANRIADHEGDLSELLGLAQERLGDDSKLYCVSSSTMIEFVLSNRYSSMKIVWLHEIRSRLICLENKDTRPLFDVRIEDACVVAQSFRELAYQNLHTAPRASAM